MLTVNSRLLKAVSLCVSTEEVRYYLNGVYFEKHPTKPGVIMVATDGHTLLAAYDETAELADNMVSCIMPIDKGLLSKLTPKSGEFSRRVEFDGKSVRVLTVYREGDEPELITAAASKPIDGTFPDWRLVMPDAEALAQTKTDVYADVYIARLAAVSKALGGGGIIVIGGGESVALVRFTNSIYRGFIFGVIMPFHESARDDLASLPDWAAT